MKCIIVTFVFSFLILSVTTYKILGIFLHAGKSHFNVFQPLLESLSGKGHEVTVISFFPSSKKLPTYRDITLKIPLGESKEVLELSNFTGSRFEKYFAINAALMYMKTICDQNLNLPEYQDALKTKEKFDLIISEFFMTNCMLLPFLKKYDIPFIGIKSHVMMPWENVWVGNPDHPAYIPSIFMDYSKSMSFLDKLEGTLVLIYNNAYYKWFFEEQDFNLVEKHFGVDFLPSKDALYNVSLILVHSHFSLHGSRPFVSNVIEFQGIHIQSCKPLPQHIEKWINESTHGVIYFSLGSMIKGHSFPEDKRQMFIRAFSRFPQRVLWKWEADTMPEKPENIMIEKWMPQFDILCHPNVKAFIAHGGLLGVTESVHCGVPLIVMPQFGDQFTNAKAIEANGGGVILEYRSLDEESIVNALKTVLDPSFNKKAKELSARFRDRPMPPLETAIYWVEYVARHGGAPHLRTAAVGMPLYQYLLLDVIAFLSVILFILMYISFVITRALYRKIFKIKEKVKQN